MSDREATEVTLDVEPGPRPRARRVALAVGAVAVLGGAVFAGLSLADDGNAPEDPVRAMLEAVEQGDVLGALEQLEPGERDAVREPLTELVSELNRLDILAGADLGDLSGVDVGFEELELESETVGDGVAAVRITGGTGRFAFDAAELPLGGFVRDLLGDSIDDAESSGEDDISSGDADDFIATVKRDGRWYVSIGYSVAEAARRDAGVAFDEMGEGVTAKGADSPEGAIRELVTAVQEVDVRRMVELLPPGELGAVHAYAGLFLDEAVAAAEDASGEVEIDIATLDLDSETSGDHATVFVRDVEFSARAGEEGSVSYSDGCITLSIPGQEPEEICQDDDPAAALGETLGGGLLGNGMLGEDPFGGIEPPELSFEGEQPAFGIATVRVDGKWYVSPTRTVLDNMVETFRLFEPQDLVEIRRFVEDLFASLEEAFTSAFEDFEDFEATPDECLETGPDGGQPCTLETVPTTVAPPD